MNSCGLIPQKLQTRGFRDRLIRNARMASMGAPVG
jgi:hypothetical protein